MKSAQHDVRPLGASPLPPQQAAHQDSAQEDDGSVQPHVPDAADKPDGNHVNAGQAALDSQHADDANGWDTADLVLDELPVTEASQGAAAGEPQVGTDDAAPLTSSALASSLSFSPAAAGPVHVAQQDATATDAGVEDAVSTSRGSSGQEGLVRDRSIAIPSGVLTALLWNGLAVA